MEKLSSIGQFEWLRNEILGRKDKGKTIVQVCMTGCRAYGAADVKEALSKEVGKYGFAFFPTNPYPLDLQDKEWVGVKVT